MGSETIAVKDQDPVGIHAIGLAVPSYRLAMEELAALRKVSPNKYHIGLGCHQMALCHPDENVVSLAIQAGQRALKHWGGNPNDIGLVAVGTESGYDMSRPLSAWVMEGLNLTGAIRSYEVKHACFGGTVALRQALEWKQSDNGRHKAALVVATDEALYAPGHPGEPTQGAGAIAMIIDKPTIASIHPKSYPWSDPQYDFWRPIGQAFPEVNGHLSITCYAEAVYQCFNQLCKSSSLIHYLDEFTYMGFHIPFPKMVYKALQNLSKQCRWPSDYLMTLYREKVAPTLAWNQNIGNSYTSSLWIAVAKALTLLQPKQQMTAFSYGSGFGAELLTLQCSQNQATAPWVAEFETDLQARIPLSAKEYEELRESDML